MWKRAKKEVKINDQKIKLKILGSEYTINSDENQEYMLKVINFINDKVEEVRSIDKLNKLSNEKISILTSVNVADEFFRMKEELDQMKLRVKELEGLNLTSRDDNQLRIDQSIHENISDIESEKLVDDKYFENKAITKLEKAIGIALDSHKGKKDQLGREYILHPLEVMMNLHTTEEKIAGVLHDVIEDSKVTIKELKGYGVPEVVLDALELLSHDKCEPYMDYIKRLSTNKIARAVKKADLLNNTKKERMYELKRMNPKKADQLIKEKYIPALKYLK